MGRNNANKVILKTQDLSFYTQTLSVPVNTPSQVENGFLKQKKKKKHTKEIFLKKIIL